MKEYDALTGVLTRKSFCQLAEELVKRDTSIEYDIVLSDFVNFKHFNERFGTEKGDLLLIRTGEMLKNTAVDTLCGRYGGDRFVSIVPHLPKEALAYLEHFAIPEEARAELPVDNIVVKFGICAKIDPTIPISVSCDRAYSALKAVKHQYGQNVAVYDQNLEQTLKRELFIEENMQRAIKEKQFEVFYQPKMDLNSGQNIGAEALVRWIHPTLGMISPAEFIPQFEKNGFISEMDRYVWERVCQDLLEWKESGCKILPVSINVSRKDFDMPDLVEYLLGLLERYQIPTELLHLEVTESSYAENPEHVVQCVNRLHESGFVIELDDFGAGFTSLSSLNDVTFDILKCDMSILRKDKPESGKSVLSFAVQLAKMMNLRMIQEGVETKEQLERLRELGCDYIQGYYYSRPLPKKEFVNFLGQCL